MSLSIVVIGLSITSSWGNGHATTYRGLLRALHERGHDVTFLERDVPWYAQNRDLPAPPYARTHLYSDLAQLQDSHRDAVAFADLVIVGSYVPEGIAVGRWVQQTARGVKAFYDIDTPVTLDAMARGECAYLNPALIPGYELYLSFTGGPTLRHLEHDFGAPRAAALYCSVDPAQYFPEAVSEYWDLGYLGTYAPDRQPALERLFLEPARRWEEGRFVQAGPQFPPEVQWAANIHRLDHLPPDEHRRFYNSQRFTLNVTREAMVRLGWSPSIRLFEAAACGTPIVSDQWAGLDQFFTPGREILLADDTEHVVEYLRRMPPEQRISLGEKARRRVLAEHTADHRAEQLEILWGEVRGKLPHRAATSD